MLACRSGSRLRTRRQQASAYAGQVCTSRRNLRTERDGCLHRSSIGIAPDEAILYQQHRIAKARSAGTPARHIKTVGDHRDHDAQVKVPVETPRKVEISLVRESGPAGRGDRSRPKGSVLVAACIAICDFSGARWVGAAVHTSPLLGGWGGVGCGKSARRRAGPGSLAR